MEQQPLDYVGADPVFFDTPGALRSPDRRSYAPPPELDWSSWEHLVGKDWEELSPGAGLPEQGWKVHVSATLENAQRLLNTVAQYAWSHRLAFKWIPTEAEFLYRNSKAADRGSSGKFITIYPRGDDELRQTLWQLDTLVGGEAGPHILSDVRWNRGPLHVRYGAFISMRTLNEKGEAVEAIRTPDGGMEPDRRDPVFSPPAWLELPPFIAEQVASLGKKTAPAGFPYEELRPLHYSNGGGVYLAIRTADGQKVVIKEGRPFAGLTPDGRDAVDRLRVEEEALRRLAGDPAAPQVLDAFEEGEHRFLVIEHIEGMSLNKELTTRAPLIRALSTDGDYARYREWALGICAQLDVALARFHAAGIVLGDVHPRNIMIETATGRAVFIDFEMAQERETAVGNVLGAPGFAPPRELVGAAADRYSLACVKLFLFLPLTHLIPLEPAKAADLVDAAALAYRLPDDFAAKLHAELDRPTTGRPLSVLAQQAQQTIAAWPTDSEDGIGRIALKIGRAIAAGVDYTRADRCFPGDARQFGDGAVGLAHGSAGVVLALSQSRLDIDTQAFEWLDAAVEQNHRVRLGLFDGLTGVAWMRRTIGDHRGAGALRERILTALPERLAPGGENPLESGVYGGLAGLGLYLLEEDSGDALSAAEAIAAELLRRAEASRESQHGLMWGPSGVSLFATRFFERTGDERMLRLAHGSLEEDLAVLAETPDGTLQLDEGWRLMPYLATGSAGVGLALAQLIPHADDPERLLAILGKIERAAQAPFAIEPGLFNGRAGFIHFLIALRRLGYAAPESAAALEAHVDALRLHALRYSTGIAFPGTGLLRLSLDLATGSAGVLTALEAYRLQSFDARREGWQLLLPLVSPQSARRRAPIPH